MEISSATRSVLSRIHAQDPQHLRQALDDVAAGDQGAVDQLSRSTGIHVGELRAVAAQAALDSGLDAIVQIETDMARGKPNAAPTSRDLLAVRSGEVDASTVAQKLKAALLSSKPQVVNQAARTLQIVESYQRKQGQDRTNYVGTGFVPFRFPELDMRFSDAEARQLAAAVGSTRNGATADIVSMAIRRGVLGVANPEAVVADPRIADLTTGASGVLPGSDGAESPRGGAKSFHDEWVSEAEPGLKNIREAIIKTAEARGLRCPFARGNHAKGVEFGDVTMKTSEAAPDWVKELFGTMTKGGMVRVSGSQTNPDEPDSQPHQPGVRITLPLAGRLEDGTAKQIFDITCNSGETTHADTARKHTWFTRELSTAGEGLSSSKPARLAKFLGGGIFSGELFERVGQIKKALDATKAANQQPFHEHDLYGRHAYFMDGRYVQFRIKVIEPQDFANPVNSKKPNARLDAVADTVANRGMKIAMFVTEIPEGKASMAEDEGWQGLREQEYLAGTFEVPPQVASSSSAAHKYMEAHSFIPAGADKVATGVGLGRHRTVVYQASQEQRLRRRTMP